MLGQPLHKRQGSPRFVLDYIYMIIKIKMSVDIF